jgi:hypothetical protein
MKSLSEEELRERARRERAERELRDARWEARRRSRHRVMAITGGLVAVTLYGLAASAGHVSIGAWIILGLSGVSGAYLISRFEVGILTAAILYGACVILGTVLSYTIGCWRVSVFQCLLGSLGLSFSMMVAGLIALQVDIDDL